MNKLDPRTIVQTELAKADKIQADRLAFQSKQLKNFPPAYRNLIGNDPTKWAAEAKELETQFKEDLRQMGAQIPNVGGGGTDGRSVLDVSTKPEKSAVDLIQSGLRTRDQLYGRVRVVESDPFLTEKEKKELPIWNQSQTP